MKLRSVFFFDPRVLLLAGATLATLSCASPDTRLAQLSAPHVECDQGEITIADIRKQEDVTSYSAYCPGDRRWICDSTERAGDKGDTQCWREDVEYEPISPVVSPVTATPGPWREVVFDICPLRGILPANIQAIEPTGVPEGAVSGTLQSVFEDRVFVLGCARVLGMTEDKYADAVNGALESVARSLGGIVESAELVEGQRAVNATILLPDEGGVVIVRTYVEGEFLFQAMAAPREHIPAHELVKFFNAVTVGPPPSASQLASE